MRAVIKLLISNCVIIIAPSRASKKVNYPRSLHSEGRRGELYHHREFFGIISPGKGEEIMFYIM